MPVLERRRYDLTATIKGLKASRSLLVFAVLTLAFGIGVNGAMLGLVDRALLSPPQHLHAPQDLFTLAFEPPGGGAARMTSTSYPTFRTIRDEVPAVTSAAAWQSGPSAVVIDRKQVEAHAEVRG